jgi:hypothetical protein
MRVGSPGGIVSVTVSWSIVSDQPRSSSSRKSSAKFAPEAFRVGEVSARDGQPHVADRGEVADHFSQMASRCAEDRHRHALLPRSRQPRPKTRPTVAPRRGARQSATHRGLRPRYQAPGRSSAARATCVRPPATIAPARRPSEPERLQSTAIRGYFPRSQALVPETERDLRRSAPIPQRRNPRKRRGSDPMELGGLEPPTSWVRSRRSPN